MEKITEEFSKLRNVTLFLSSPYFSNVNLFKWDKEKILIFFSLRNKQTKEPPTKHNIQVIQIMVSKQAFHVNLMSRFVQLLLRKALSHTQLNYNTFRPEVLRIHTVLGLLHFSPPSFPTLLQQIFQGSV